MALRNAGDQRDVRFASLRAPTGRTGAMPARGRRSESYGRWIAFAIPSASSSSPAR